MLSVPPGGAGLTRLVRFTAGASKIGIATRGVPGAVPSTVPVAFIEVGDWRLGPS
jgi:hypothetical protein